MPKLTTAQLWLVHSLETLFFGAIVTGGISVYQAIGTGNYDAQALAAIFIPAAIAVLAKGSSAVISNNNTFQAGEDTLNQLTASHQVLSTQVQQLSNASHTHLPEPVMQAPVAPPQPAQTPNALTPTMTPPVQSVPVQANPVATGATLPQQAPMQQPVVPPAQTRDAWSNSALMQAIGKPPQTQQ